MSKRTKRLSRSPQSYAQRDQFAQNALQLSVTVGRRPSYSPAKKLALLPRPQTTVSTGLERLADLRRDQARLRFRTLASQPIYGRLPVSRQIARQRALNQWMKRAQLASQESTPCRQREKRRQIMFALNVAGRKWGPSGGPNMKNAKRTSMSYYTCTR